MVWTGDTLLIARLFVNGQSETFVRNASSKGFVQLSYGSARRSEFQILYG